MAGLGDFNVGFDTGGGGSAIGAFLGQITDRLKMHDELKMKSQAQVGTAVNEQQALMPGKVTEAGQVEDAKMKAEYGAKQAFAKSNMENMQNLFSGGTPGGAPGGGGSFAPGSTVTANPSTGEISYNMPLNQKYGSDESGIVSTAAVVRPAIQDLKTILNSSTNAEVYGSSVHPAISGMGRAIPGMSPGIDAAQAIRSKLTRINFEGFTFGGKQLTGEEKKVLTDLSNPIGKSKRQAISDLDFLDSLLNGMDQATQNGRTGAMNFSELYQQQAQQARQGTHPFQAAQPQAAHGVDPSTVAWD